ASADRAAHVLFPEPGSPVSEAGTILAGGEPVYIPLTAEDGWFPDFAAVDPATAPPAKLLWLLFPVHHTRPRGPSCYGSATPPTRPARWPPPTSWRRRSSSRPTATCCSPTTTPTPRSRTTASSPRRSSRSQAPATWPS